MTDFAKLEENLEHMKDPEADDEQVIVSYLVGTLSVLTSILKGIYETELFFRAPPPIPDPNEDLEGFEKYLIAAVDLCEEDSSKTKGAAIRKTFKHRVYEFRVTRVLMNRALNVLKKKLENEKNNSEKGGSDSFLPAEAPQPDVTETEKENIEIPEKPKTEEKQCQTNTRRSSRIKKKGAN